MRYRFDPILGRLIDFEISADGGDGGGDGGGEERPDWLPEKFKTPQDMVAAYGAAEAEMGRLRTQADQDREEFREAIERMEASVGRQQEREIQTGGDPLLEAYQRAVDEGDANAQLAITMQLMGAQTAGLLDQKLAPLNERFQSEAASTREILIDNAEAAVAAEARAAGLDYEASRDEVAEAIKALGGLPASGDLETFKDAIRRGVRLVHADAVLQHSAQQEKDRRAKLSSMTTPVGVPGRVAQGTDVEKSRWDEIKGTPTGSFAELMAKAGKS